MITLIRFRHNDRPVTAKVVFNCEKYKKEVLVELLSCHDELGDRLLIKQIDGRWTTDSDISKNFRSTYLDILNEINWILSQKYYDIRVVHENSDEVNLN